MTGVVTKSFDNPSETRTPDKARMEVVDLGSVKAARVTMQPGWRWSESITPIVGTESCQAHHVGVVVAGTIHIKHGDGTEAEARTGDAYVIEPGHDAWIVGDETFVAYEFDSTTAATYAKP